MTKKKIESFTELNEQLSRLKFDDNPKIAKEMFDLFKKAEKLNSENWSEQHWEHVRKHFLKLGEEKSEVRYLVGVYHHTSIPKRKFIKTLFEKLSLEFVNNREAADCLTDLASRMGKDPINPGSDDANQIISETRELAFKILQQTDRKKVVGDLFDVLQVLATGLQSSKKMIARQTIISDEQFLLVLKQFFAALEKKKDISLLLKLQSVIFYYTLTQTQMVKDLERFRIENGKYEHLTNQLKKENADFRIKLSETEHSLTESESLISTLKTDIEKLIDRNRIHEEVTATQLKNEHQITLNQLKEKVNINISEIEHGLPSITNDETKSILQHYVDEIKKIIKD